MGLFRKTQNQDEAMRTAEDIAAGRGVTGKLARAFMGSENAERMQGGLAAARSSMEAANAAAAGYATMTATVSNVIDTGQLINHDPIVVITAVLENGTTVQVQSLVSKLQVPRPGDAIALVENPAQPGTLAYAGPAVS